MAEELLQLRLLPLLLILLLLPYQRCRFPAFLPMSKLPFSASSLLRAFWISSICLTSYNTQVHLVLVFNSIESGFYILRCFCYSFAVHFSAVWISLQFLCLQFSQWHLSVCFHFLRFYSFLMYLTLRISLLYFWQCQAVWKKSRKRSMVYFLILAFALVGMPE